MLKTKRIILALIPLLCFATFHTNAQDVPPPPPEPEYAWDEVEKTPLILAIEANNLEKVKELVANGADINNDDWSNESPLEAAIKKQSIPIVRFLLENGAKGRYGIGASVKSGNIPLTKLLIEYKFYLGESVVYAAENNNLEMVQLLASNGADVDFSQKRRSGLFRKYYVSPVGEAVSKNNLEMVNVLIEHGVSREDAIEEALNFGKNDMILSLSAHIEDKGWLLIEAFKRSNDLIVKKLISEGVPPNSEDELGNSMLLIAASNGDLSKVRTCIENYTLYLHKKNNSGENALMKSAEKGSQQVCAYLINQGIKLDAQNNIGETALFYAVDDDSKSTFDFLLAKGGNINHTSENGNTLLIKAASNQQKNTVAYLISLGADIHHKNNSGYTAFYCVISHTGGYSSSENSLINTFIAAGADVKTKGNDGETLLFNYIERGELDQVKELIAMGADPNTQNRNGERPACSKSEVIKFLIEKGADINATDNWDNTYLCQAIKQNDIELAYFLVNKGIDVNKRCYFDEQAIIKAIEAENITLVQFLTENGADVNAIGYGRKNVMDYAVKQGNDEIISYLRSHGAMTKEERNEQYKKSIKLEGEIKSALIAEDLPLIISLMSQHDVIILQEKVVQDIAYVAAKKGHAHMMNKLLSDDVAFDIDSPVNAIGQTALFIAAIYGQNDLVIDLLAKGADANQLDKNGKSTAEYASKKSTKKIFKKWTKNN